MATFTFDGSTSQTIDFNVAVDRIVFDLNAEDLAIIGEDRTANTVTVAATSGAILTLTNTNLEALQAGDGAGTNNFIAGIDSDIVFDFGTRGADGDLTGNVVVGLEGVDSIIGSTDTGSTDDEDGRPGALLLGNQGVDTISNGDSFSVRMYGGMSNDTLNLATSNRSDASLLVGGLGGDTITVDATTAGRSYEGHVTVLGGNDAGDPTDGADTITANLANDGSALIYGNGGNDAVTVTASASLGGGNATVFGGQGNDTISATVEGGEFYGGLAVDTITVVSDTVGGEAINGVVPEDASGTFVIYGGNEAGDPTDGRDTITVTLNDDDTASIFGNGGDDDIELTGTADAHVSVFGGQGNDTIDGSIGDESIVYGGLGSDDILVDVVADDTDAGNGGDSTGNSATVFGGNGDSDAADGADEFIVTVEDDATVTIFGNGGNDDITFSGAGDKIVFGGAGDDRIELGDASPDFTVTGGAGEDTFVNRQGPTEGADPVVDDTDVGFITDVNFDQDHFDFPLDIDSTADLVNFTPRAGNEAEDFGDIAEADDLTEAANEAIDFAVQADFIDVGENGAVVFSFEGESYLTIAFGAVQPVDAGEDTGASGNTNLGIVRITGFTGEIGADDFVNDTTGA